MVMVKVKYQTPPINGIKLYLNVYRLYLKGSALPADPKNIKVIEITK